MIILTGFAIGVSQLGSALPAWVLFLQNGLTASAVGLVALAGFKLSGKLLADPVSAAVGSIAAVLAINLYKEAWLFPVLMIFGGVVSWAESVIVANRKKQAAAAAAANGNSTAQEDNEIQEAIFRVGFSYSPRTGLFLIATWFVLLIVAIVLRTATNIRALNLFGTMYFVGSIIFGGGPVVIPLLQNYVVTNGWLSDSEFLIGLAIVNALPGPNFNLAAYVGALAMRGAGTNILGAIIANIGIFLPGLLLMSGLLPLWNRYRNLKIVKSIFKGVNAAAVGLVFAAIYLLAQKAIAPVDGGGLGIVLPLTQFPVYVGIAVFSYTASGFLNLPTPFAIIIGGLMGILDWLAHNRP
ncbi:chromate transporter-domain-containing protein [Entophlyctis helioformis]|nr:chromate transporter-domain-containing protein [Entophlyctis helioformis]